MQPRSDPEQTEFFLQLIISQSEKELAERFCLISIKIWEKGVTDICDKQLL